MAFPHLRLESSIPLLCYSISDKNSIYAMFNHYFARIGIVLTIFLGFGCNTISPKEKSTTIDWSDNQLVLDINQFTYTIANQHDQFYSFIGVRALAMVHLTIHDILNGHLKEYESYHYKDSIKLNQPKMAMIVAMKTLLLAAYPGRKDTIEAVSNRWLDDYQLTDETSEDAQWGERVAQSYLQLRAGDGHEKKGDYTPMTKPGDYQYTPGFDWVWKPDFSVAKPFTLDSLTQFRSPPPPPIMV